MPIADTALNVSEHLLSASDDSFSSSLALMDELSLLNLMLSKAAEVVEKVGNKLSQGTWSSESDHFQSKLAAKTRQFAALSRGERLLLCIGELQKLMGVRPRDLHSRLDLAEVADDLCTAGVKILRGDKAAKFTGNDVGAMIEFYMTKIFGGLDIRMDELSSDQQQKLVDRIREFLQSLPSDQQRFVMEKLGAPDLSASAIRQAIATGGMWAAFAAAVQVFGFAFYTTAAQLLAILTAHLLPFGAYVGLSSFVAVVSSLWMLPVFAGVGVWIYHAKNRDLRKSMAPLIITSLCLSGMEESQGLRESATEEALSLWKSARELRDEKRSATANAKRIRDQARERLAVTRSELSHARDRKRKAIAQRENLEEKLAQVVMSSVPEIVRGQWGGKLTAAATKFQEAWCEIVQKGGRTSWLWMVAPPLGLSVEAIRINRRLKSAADPLIQQVKSNWQSQGSGYPSNAASLLAQMEEQTSQVLSAGSDIARLTAQERNDSRNLAQAAEQLTNAESAQAESERRYYGLGTV
jgi:CHASE3 domain sensor protein